MVLQGKSLTYCGPTGRIHILWSCRENNPLSVVTQGESLTFCGSAERTNYILWSHRENHSHCVVLQGESLTFGGSAGRTTHILWPCRVNSTHSVVLWGEEQPTSNNNSRTNNIMNIVTHLSDMCVCVCVCVVHVSMANCGYLRGACGAWGGGGSVAIMHPDHHSADWYQVCLLRPTQTKKHIKGLRKWHREHPTSMETDLSFYSHYSV